jgi:hypothetical protein
MFIAFNLTPSLQAEATFRKRVSEGYITEALLRTAIVSHSESLREYVGGERVRIPVL